MRLKKLEIKGFKSFGDKTEIEFHEGVTAIVGPNGCGKSNIVDAIRWVLGEQKIKTLRSDKMESVIFNGTQTRRPAQMAEVSLTFENHKQILPPEYTQVTITRRYYRTGESEYLLNHVPCRLKDITNLFLDTGIGADSYAIIELKMIDEILSDKDGSRRGLFEKAAGISKFKTRKKEALNRLAEVDTDLARIEDLLAEIEKNLKTLEKQAKQTEKYFSLKNEYKTVSLQYAKKAIHNQQTEYTQLAEKIKTETERRKQLHTQLQNLEQQLENQKNIAEKAEQLFTQKQKEYTQHLTQLRQLENENKLKTERLHFNNEKINNFKQQISQDSRAIQDLCTQLETLKEQAQIAQQNFEQQEKNLQELKQQIEWHRTKISEIEQILKQKRQETEKLQHYSFQLNKQYEVKHSQILNTRLQLEKLLQANSQQVSEVSRYEKDLQEILSELEQVRQKHTFLQKEEEQKAQRITEFEQEIEHLRNNLVDLNRLIDAKKNEYLLTKSLIDNMEGFPEALKFLKKNTEWSNNAQLLSDVLTCQEEYRIAIENYLEPFINYYVVETELEAYKAIHFLRQDLKGKAHFFVLDNIQPNGSMPTNGELKAIAALSVVETEKKYSKLIEQLLADVYIVENQSDIKELKHHDKTFITKDGSIIKKKVSLSGGSVGAFEGKRIGRAKHLEKLTTEIENLETQYKQIQSQLAQIQEQLIQTKQSSLKKAIEDTQKEINYLNEQLIALKTKKEQIQKLLSNSSLQKEDLQADLNEWQYELQELIPQIKTLQENLQTNQNYIETQQDILQAENEVLTNLISQYTQQNMAFFQQQNKLNTLWQEINFKTQTKENLQKKVENNEVELKKLLTEIETLNQNNLFDNDQIAQLKNQTNTLEAELKKAELDYYKAKGNIVEIEREIKEKQKSKENLDFVLNQLNEKLHESQLALTSVQERLSAEFNINVTTWLKENKPEYDSPLSEKELKIQIDDLKEKIERVGTINPMAMEAYNEMKQRYDFIQEQKNDLLGSKNTLLKTIQEMEQHATQSFMTAFQAIRSNFIQVFRSLFSEQDSCDLLLSDEKNPLESEVEIIAKPKGKRPLSINQLSGGEKALTAISLLFALYLLKPAPFCIFDEVDAPLDDANTDKFNNIIKNFSKQSQFLIVTHNKRTMLMADVLYGVTMIEQGVSRTVPADLQTLNY
ncbi:MAG: chromosome segregation protein SMC [Microscillaceae bacterium]|nr:chromosome segregation protein SMC [Microscillaceae bacterium]MDW8461536.1 chromosome segregation protein SMC [Cytophagales bacterium]